jgi:hypothetical protein
MDVTDFILAVAFGGTFLTMIFFVVFGQVTVRRLRKNPATRDALGLEFASGWDIVNVAQTLSMPESINRFLDESPLAFLNANHSALKDHVTTTDKVLGRLFFWSLVISAIFIFIMVLFL